MDTEITAQAKNTAKNEQSTLGYDWVHMSASQLMEAISNRQISCSALLECFINRIEQYNDKINAVVTHNYPYARKKAQLADEALNRGEWWGPLHGLPMTIKDTYETTHMATSAGIPQLSQHIAKQDADVVQQMQKAGAIIFGKTNIPALAMDVQTYNKVFGTTNNPWNQTYTAGGSSGGAAAALAAGFTPLEVGSDIAGSIRTPSSHCGVYGHKPSYGIVPVRGHIPGTPGSLSHVDLVAAGPLARSATDLNLALDVLITPDQFNRKGSSIKLPEARHNEIKNYRVACWLDEPCSPVDIQVKKRLSAVVNQLTALGVSVDEQARPDIEFQQSLNMYLQLLGSAISGGIGALEMTALKTLSLAAMPFGKIGLIKNLPFYNLMKGITLSHKDWHALHEARMRVRQQWEIFFQHYDVLLTPVAPTPAYPHQTGGNPATRFIRVNGKLRFYVENFNWIHQATAAYLPATAVPAGLSDGNLPVGMQIIGGYMEDKTTIRFAELLEEKIIGYQKPPLGTVSK